MSQEPIPTEAVEGATPESGAATEIQRNGYKIKLGIFESKATLAGFSFYYPEFESLGAAVDQYGEGKVLEMVNSKIAFAIRTKAQNNMKKEAGESDDDFDNRLRENIEQGNIVILTPEDAEAWKPGDREVTSESGIIKKMKEAMEAAKKAHKEGKLELKAVKVNEAKEFKRQLDELTASRLEEVMG